MEPPLQQQPLFFPPNHQTNHTMNDHLGDDMAMTTTTITTTTAAFTDQLDNATISKPNYVTILCCVCGIPIAPNAANTCANCLASTADVTRGISTEVTLHQCRGCQRWHKDAGKWMACELESRELMALCLSHVNGLAHSSSKKKKTNAGGPKPRLVDAGWIWTEPHSMRLKVRLTLQQEVQVGTILQQSMVVVFVVRNQQCIECQAHFRQGAWKSLVQVRQRVNHKRTFLYLEQLILKQEAHRGCLRIETIRDGMDFYFADRNKAARFISFLENVVPIKVKASKKLIGLDDKSNVANYKYTNYVEICPLCKDDLVYLPRKTARSLGNISRLVLVKNISNQIHFIDPRTGQVASMIPDAYWRDPLKPILTAAKSHLKRFVVLGKEPLVLERNVSKRNTARKQRNRLATVTLAKEQELGVVTDCKYYEEASHIGYLFKSGDVAVGYDLTESQLMLDEQDEEEETDEERRRSWPDVLVVRKIYTGAAASSSGNMDDDDDQSKAAKAKKMRIWKLRRLDVDMVDATGGEDGDEVEAVTTSRSQRKKKGVKGGDEDEDMDEEIFMQEVEADREMRNNINLYKNEALLAKQQKAIKASAKVDNHNNNDDEEEEDEDDIQIKLEELLDGLDLDAEPDTASSKKKKNDKHKKKNNEEDDEDMDHGSGELLLEEGQKAAQDGIAYVGREEARRVKPRDAAVPVPGNTFGKDYDLKDFKFI